MLRREPPNYGIWTGFGADQAQRRHPGTNPVLKRPPRMAKTPFGRLTWSGGHRKRGQSPLRAGQSSERRLYESRLVDAGHSGGGLLRAQEKQGGSKPPVPVGKGLVGFLLGRVGKPGVGVALGSRSEG